MLWKNISEKVIGEKRSSGSWVWRLWTHDFFIAWGSRAPQSLPLIAKSSLLRSYQLVVLDGFDQHYQASVHLTLSCTINESPQHLELILEEVFFGNSESRTRCSLVWSANATSMLCHPLLILTLSYRILWGCLQSVAPTSVAQLPSPASKSSRQPRSSKVKRGQSPVRGLEPEIWRSRVNLRLNCCNLICCSYL